MAATLTRWPSPPCSRVELSGAGGCHMSGRLHGKVAVVTGAGQGIGRATALAFLNEGARVIATDLSPAGLTNLSSQRCIPSQLDVTDPDAIERLALQVGPVDILFNAAGVVHVGDVLTCSEAQWDQTFAVNVKSQFLTIKSFLPKMLERGGGSIVNVASVVGGVKTAVNRFAYAASKAAVVGMSKAVAADYVTRGVRCNAICPGTVASPSLNERISEQAQSSGQTIEQVRAAFVARQPMRRLGTPEEIALLAVYLASDESRFVTGTSQIIDGGWSA